MMAHTYDFDCFGHDEVSIIDVPSSVKIGWTILIQKATLLQNNLAPFSSNLESPDDALENPGYDQGRFPADARSI